ncbi:MAG TPA: histidine--tRNA ligase [Acidimicrobiales bacterium]|jgi:histidyl-tRNA synthetase|nr:histidine--tRNA ligase [Acidimicrobiales bacterium]
MPETFRAPIGTQDVLPPASARWQALIATFARVTERFGYGLVHGPLFEDLGVFQRLGVGTDVVRKEMYDFRDKGDRHLALRPEATASVVRAFVQHRPPTPWKVWCVTPVFRYERPQAGRLRQHHQVDVEAIGVADPDIDIEIIALGAAYLDALGLRRCRLVLNTMGTPADRVAYANTLIPWLRERAADLAPADREKVETHPLRVLDSKRPQTAAVVDDAPRIADVLDDASRQHFERVQEGLRAAGIPFEIDPGLVRGLDYYTHTLFEFQSAALDTAQSTVIGGGRYDGLVEQLGGSPTPGIGFGSGVERMLLACDAEGVFDEPPPALDAFVVDATDGRTARDITQELRSAGLRVDRAFGGRSMKSQMKAAGRSGARVAVIIGDQEVGDATATVRDLAQGEQQVVPRDKVADVVRKLVDPPEDR